MGTPVNSAFEQRGNAERTADGAHVLGDAAVFRGRGACDHLHSGHVSKRIGDFIGQGIGERCLLAVIGKILEREHRDRRQLGTAVCLVTQPQGRHVATDQQLDLDGGPCAVFRVIACKAPAQSADLDPHGRVGTAVERD